MPRSLTVLLLIILFNLGSGMRSAACQNADSLISTEKHKELIKIRTPGDEFFNRYRGEETFDYRQQYVNKSNNDVLNRLIRKILYIWNRGLKAFSNLPLAVKLPVIILVLAIAFFLIMKSRIYRMFYTVNPVEQIQYNISGSDDGIRDFDEAVARQIALGNYRYAIRILHLKILNDLGEKGYIKTSGVKTNREYFYEISNSSLKKSFQYLAGVYNAVWYGNYPVSESEFKNIRLGFNDFSSKVHES